MAAAVGGLALLAGSLGKEEELGEGRGKEEALLAAAQQRQGQASLEARERCCGCCAS